MACILQLWIFFGALVSSDALDRWNTRCKEVTISASLKSEVFLPCHFNISSDSETVKWSNSSSGATLLRIKNNGLFYLDSPREGRVSVLPLLFKDGNFSILIHDLEPSDFGPYFCDLRNECWRVEIIQSEHPVEKTLEVNSYKPWLFFFAGTGLFAILFVVFNRTGLHNRCMRCMKSSKCCSINEEHQEHDSSNQSSIQQRAFRTPDPTDSTTTTVYYVNQA